MPTEQDHNLPARSGQSSESNESKKDKTDAHPAPASLTYLAPTARTGKPVQARTILRRPQPQNQPTKNPNAKFELYTVSPSITLLR